MSGLEWFFLSIGGVGLGFLVISFLFGELGDLFDFDLSDSADMLDSPDWHDLRVIAAGLTGFGFFGFATVKMNFSTLVAFIVATVAFFAVSSILFFWILKPLLRQQYNSMFGRESFRNQPAMVVLQINSDTPGLVEFLDSDGATIRQLAKSDKSYPKGARVLIYEVDGDCVYVMDDPSNPA